MIKSLPHHHCSAVVFPLGLEMDISRDLDVCVRAADDVLKLVTENHSFDMEVDYPQEARINNEHTGVCSLTSNQVPLVEAFSENEE